MQFNFIPNLKLISWILLRYLGLLFRNFRLFFSLALTIISLSFKLIYLFDVIIIHVISQILVVIDPCSVVRFAFLALATHNMEFHFGLRVAVVAHHNHLCVTVLFWHRHGCYLVIKHLF